jgi:hypothetical protein
MIKTTNHTEVISRKVTLQGISDVMFDRYPGDNNSKLEPWQKLYLIPNSKVISLPALNINSFLCAHNTNSAPKRLRDARQFKKIANSIMSFTNISPAYIPFIRNGESIEFGKLENDVDPKSGVYIHYAVARLDKGIPNPKVRPVLPLPWELSFEFTLFPNKEIKEQEILNLIEEGGRAIGLGTWRGIFGKFFVSSWD